MAVCRELVYNFTCCEMAHARVKSPHKTNYDSNIAMSAKIASNLVHSMTMDSHLVDESPSRPDAVLDVANDPVAVLQAGVVVQRGPDLRENLLQFLKRIMYIL